MEQEKSLKDEIIAAIDFRFTAFEKRLGLLEEGLGSFERRMDDSFDRFKQEFRLEISAEIDEKWRYHGILLERIEYKVDVFGDRLEMLDEKIDRQYEELRGLRAA